MDIKKALKILKQVDSIDNLDTAPLEHNESHILSLNKLYDLDEHLASQFEELELAAPYLFNDELGFSKIAKRLCQDEDVEVIKGTPDDSPYRFYLKFSNYNFGITDR